VLHRHAARERAGRLGLIPGEGWALVARVDFGACALFAPDGTLFQAGVRGRVMGRKKALGNAVVVGDRVRFEPGTEPPVIAEVEPRRNAFSRRAAGEQAGEQVVAANLDQVVLVASLDRPEFSPGLADRVLAQAEHAGIPARLVLNKTDLGAPERARALLAEYERAGVPCHAVCAVSGEGAEALRHALLGRRSLLVGHSGVGKSTLLNRLVPGVEHLVGQVNEKTGKGRHTTTAAVLVRPEPELELIDTPGIRSFGLWGVGARDLEQAYVEFRRFLGECRFSDCRHGKEPGCALREAVARGDVSRLRYESFLHLREELEQEEKLAETRGRRGRM
jgi:ribosome biogenesis GTPase / thiamine phosphate phosphatase